jgi:hypothetical protein
LPFLEKLGCPGAKSAIIDENRYGGEKCLMVLKTGAVAVMGFLGGVVGVLTLVDAQKVDPVEVREVVRVKGQGARVSCPLPF